MRRLAAALHDRGYAPDFDQSDYDPDNISGGISAEDEWWQRLEQMIVAADVMVFIVSPDSAASKVCDEEIAVARTIGKRLILIECRPVDYAKAPPRLADQNVKINFTVDSEDRFAEAFDALCAAINIDIKWHRENRRLTELAVIWSSEDRSDDRVFSPADIRAAETLFERRPRDTDPPAEVLAAFLDHSRTKREEERTRLRRVTGRAYIKPAWEAIQESRYDRAIRLVGAGATLSEDPSLDLNPELWPCLVSAMLRTDARARLAHSQSILDISFDRLGAHAITGCQDHVARVWDLRSANLIKSLVAHDAPVTIARVDLNLMRAVTCSKDQSILLWDMRTGRVLKTLQHGGTWLRADLAGALGKTVTSKFRDANLWDLKTGEHQATLSGHQWPITRTGFSPCGRLIITTGRDGDIRLWDSSNGKIVHKLAGGTNSVLSFAFTVDSKLVATGSTDKLIRLWEIQSGKMLAVLEGHNRRVNSLCFNTHGNLLLSSSDIELSPLLWDVKSKKKLATLSGHINGIQDIAFDDSGRYIATASDDETVRLWEAPSGKHLKTFIGHEAAVRSVTFTNDSRELITTGEEGVGYKWSLYPSLKYSHVKISSKLPPVFTCNVDTIDAVACVGQDGNCTFFSKTGLQWLSEHRLASERFVLRASQDGNFIGAVTNKKDSSNLLIIDAKNSFRIKKFKLKGKTSDLLFSQDGIRVATVEGAGSVQVWDSRTGTLLVDIDANAYGKNRVAALSRHGDILAIGGDHGVITLLDVRSGDLVSSFEASSSFITCLAFCHDGQKLLVGSNSKGTSQGEISLWNIDSSLRIVKLSAALGRIVELQCSPNGSHLISLSEDPLSFMGSNRGHVRTAEIWNLQTGDAVKLKLDDPAARSDAVEHVAIAAGGVFGEMVGGKMELGAQLCQVQSRWSFCSDIPRRELARHLGCAHRSTYN